MRLARPSDCDLVAVETRGRSAVGVNARLLVAWAAGDSEAGQAFFMLVASLETDGLEPFGTIHLVGHKWT